jgi:hypothetical protein
MESIVTMEPENGWDLTYRSFHMESMEWGREWGMDSMDSIWINPGSVKTSENEKISALPCHSADLGKLIRKSLFIQIFTKYTIQHYCSVTI